MLEKLASRASRKVAKRDERIFTDMIGNMSIHITK